MRQSRVWGAVFVLGLVIAGCGGGTQPIPPTVVVAVAPLTATVEPGATQQFSATVTGAADSSVTWSVIEGAALGSVDASGLYTAPAGLASPATATVRATSDEDPSKSATATVTLPGPDLPAILGAGWTAYVAGDLDEAEARFGEVLGFSAGHPEALTGLGWVAIDRRDIPTAVTRFDAARQAPQPVPDAIAGSVLAGAAQDDPQRVVTDGESLLAAFPEYVFVHKPQYGAGDVRWLTARAALDLGDYARVVAHLDVLSPGHGLDPERADFLEDALLLLEALRGSV